MANIKFSSFIDPVTGKVGGIVFQGTMYGPIARGKVSPRDPKSTGQQATRNAVEFVSRSWQSVPESCKEDWADLATPPENGFEKFMSYNIPRVRTGLPITLCPGIIVGIFERPEFEATFE